MSQLAVTALTVVGSIVGAYFVYLGVRYTAAKSQEGVARTADVSEQQSALEAWKELVDPLREEVGRLRAELQGEREARHEKEELDAAALAEAKEHVDKQISKLTRQIEALTSQLNEWKRMARVIARWATTMRDEILRLKGTVPATPEELLTMQAIEDAEQS